MRFQRRTKYRARLFAEQDAEENAKHDQKKTGLGRDQPYCEFALSSRLALNRLRAGFPAPQPRA